MGMLRSSRVLSLAAIAILLGPSADAALIPVTTTVPSPGAVGDCTLGEAIAAAETNSAVDACVAGSGADTISLVAGTYALASGTSTAAGVSAFVVTTPITIVGNGATLTRDPATNNLRFFEVTGTGILSMNNVTLSNGWAIGPNGAAGFVGGAGRGGAIHNSGTLTLTAVELVGNRAHGGLGGGDANQGAPGGEGQGGAIYNAGRLSLATVTATGNSVEGGRGGTGTGFAGRGGPGGLAQGGALFHLSVAAGVMVISDGRLTGNRAIGGATGVSSPFVSFGDVAGEGHGGALHAEGEPSAAVMITRTTMTDNEVVGGGAGNGGPAVPAEGLGGAISTVDVAVNVMDSTLSGNRATGGASTGGAAGLGAGLAVHFADAIVTRTAIVHNIAAGGDGFSSDGIARGGGLYANASQVFLTNVTLADNRAPDGGGGVHATGSGNVALNHATIAHNTSATAPSGVALTSGATATFAGTAIVNKLVGSSLVNCSGVVANLGGNLQFPGTTCGAGIPSLDPQLEPLREEGGTTVHPLGPLSPALDRADQAGCPATDQRGVTRPIDGDDDGFAVCDTGAYEAVPDDLIFGDGFES